MKNRTILGIIFVVLAVVVMFVVAPFFNNLASDDVDCVRLKTDVIRGTQITAAHLETVTVPSYAIPTGAYKSASEIVGKYATSQLYSGNYLTADMLSTTSISAADALENLGDGKVAISVPIGSFAGHLSGKLQNGDIVRFWVRSSSEGEASVPEELQWVEVVTTTTGSGIDQDQVVVNDDGSFTMPSTITVIVSELQAKRLGELSSQSMYRRLIHSGDGKSCQEYLDKQEAVLERIVQEMQEAESKDILDNYFGEEE